MSEWIKGSHALPPTALAGIDLNSGYMPVRRVFFYDGQPDTDRLKASLASALGQWPDFAGTIAHNSDALCLLRKDTGVRFTIEQCDDVMPPFGIDHPLGLPCPWVDEDIGKEAGDGEPVFTVKVTAYRDKRWILGTCNSHALCDGSGYWQFMQSWRDAFHNKPLSTIDSNFIRYGADFAHPPVTTVPNHLQVPAVSLFKQQMANAQHYRSAQMLLPQTALEEIKQRVNATLSPEWVSTQDIVMAMSWQCLARIAASQGAEDEQDFPLANVINIRPHLKLEHYVGNMAYSVSSHATINKITGPSLAELAHIIRRDAQDVATNDMRMHLDFMQGRLQQGHYTTSGYLTGFSLRIAEACVHGRGVMVNNWSKFPAYAMDFSGRPLWFDLATVIPMHFVMAMPSPDGVVLRFFLPDTQLHEAMAQLRTSLENIT